MAAYIRSGAAHQNHPSCRLIERFASVNRFLQNIRILFHSPTISVFLEKEKLAGMLFIIFLAALTAAANAAYAEPG